MAYFSLVNKNKIGPKIQRWLEEMNTEFNGTLLPAPSIHIEGTKTIESRHVSDGQIRLEKIKTRSANMKRYEICVQRFNAGVVNLQCTWPNCEKKRELGFPLWPTNNANDSLYICNFHRRRMESNFTKMCAHNRVVTKEYYSPGDFQGYTALIELLESAIRKSNSGRNDEDGKSLQDLFFNVKNFLIIVTTMINPNEDLLNSFLPHVMSITLEVVQARRQRSITSLVGLMQNFLEYILFFFGIMNPWDSLFPESKPYVQIGSGVGGLLGVSSLFLVSMPCAIVAMGVGVLLGDAAGKNCYINNKRRELLGESYCRYLSFRYIQKNYQDVIAEDYDEDLMYLSGSAHVDILLAAVLILQALSILISL